MLNSWVHYHFNELATSDIQISDDFIARLEEIALGNDLKPDEIKFLDQYARRLLQIDVAEFQRYSNTDDAFRKFYNPIDNNNQLNKALIQVLRQIIDFKFQQ